MILSGAMFPFDKLNRKIGSVDRVPLIAEIMPTRWTYEALMVEQFTGNEYSKRVYKLKQQMSISDFNTVYRIPKIKDAIEITMGRIKWEGRVEPENNQLPLIRNEIGTISSAGIISPFPGSDSLTPELFTAELGERAVAWLSAADKEYRRLSNAADMKLDNYVSRNKEALDIMYDDYHNDKLEEIVRKIYEKNKMLEYKDRLIQNVDPIYLEPEAEGPLNFRTHFMAPVKNFLGRKTDTCTFNIVLVLLFTLVLYALLYFNVLKRIISFFGDLRLQKD
jgi:ABC transport system ATP-binding/permease protein